MSGENVEIVQCVVDAVNGQDADALVVHVASDVEWEENEVGFPGLRRMYRGPAEVREWFVEAILEQWSRLHFEREEMTEAPGDRVLLVGVITARGKASGVETQLRFWQVFWLRGGEVTRRQEFLRRDLALEAAGLEQ